VTLVSAAFLLGACQKEGDPAVHEKLDRLQARLDSMQRKLDSMPAGAARPPARAERGGADPGAVYSVSVGDSATKGPATAKVTIVEAAEFACPFCRLAENTMDEIAKAYPEDVRFVFKHYVVHPQTATTPALATCAAQQQGKFWEMKQAIWDSAWSMENNRPRMKDATLLGEENMLKLAKELKLNEAKFKADLQSQACKDQLAKHQQELARVGVDGTPAFYVNGRPISGAQPFANFKKVIDEEIEKANAALKSGMKAEEYYEKAVVQKGKKSTSG
jgi:protein-disulfide isomerase